MTAASLCDLTLPYPQEACKYKVLHPTIVMVRIFPANYSIVLSTTSWPRTTETSAEFDGISRMHHYIATILTQL